MHIGLQIPNFTWPGGVTNIRPTLIRIVQTADEGGFYSIWVMDHFFQIPGAGEVNEPMLEGYSALNFISAVTHKVKLGTLVTGVIYRYPGILVKQVTTLDVLSGGRAYMGIGAAWNEREAKGLGINFPPLKERFKRLEEALQIATQMWQGDMQPIEGHYYHLAEPLNMPAPITQPHPPILIGGMGEEKTFRLIARYADACNLFARAGTEVVRAKLEVLRRRCDEVGRNYDEIEKTALSTINLGSGNMTAAQVIAECRELAGLGIQHLIFNMPNVSEIRPLEIIAREVIPEVAGL